MRKPPPRTVARAPSIVQQRAEEEPASPQADDAPEERSWSVPRAIALVSAASAALWLVILGVTTHLAGWPPSGF